MNLSPRNSSNELKEVDKDCSWYLAMDDNESQLDVMKIDINDYID